MYAKLIIGAALVAVGFLGGHYVAGVKGESNLAEAKAEFQKERDGWTQERLDWANERISISQASVDALEKANTDARAREELIRKGFTAAEKAYRNRIKELENEKNEAYHVAADVSPSGGLWAQVALESCSSVISGGSDKANVSSSSNASSRSAGTVSCRLTENYAKAIIEVVAKADYHTTLLNKCIADLNTQNEALAQVEKAEKTEQAKELKEESK